MFAYYKLGEPETFRLSDSAKFFPQYVYYLRRSPLIRRSKISLDEVLRFLYSTHTSDKS